MSLKVRAQSVVYLLAQPASPFAHVCCFNLSASGQPVPFSSIIYVDGDIRVPEEPGLGIELDESVVAKYRVG